MENASKALLIAAAVLVVVIIIALGMRILNSGTDTADQAQTVGISTSIQTFNAQFTMYKGKIGVDSLRALISVVNSSNTANPSHKVELKGGAIDDGKISAEAEKAGSVTVKLDYNDDGYINEISVAY